MEDIVWGSVCIDVLVTPTRYRYSIWIKEGILIWNSTSTHTIRRA
jgi:hypothetical protein